jgi:hypothetical protein
MAAIKKFVRFIKSKFKTQRWASFNQQTLFLKPAFLKTFSCNTETVSRSACFLANNHKILPVITTDGISIIKKPPKR